ncbi:HAD family hydrolase [Litorimonas sp. WD9-15]|uniref:sulfotransferase-like domain-containing protein n=1 Tax=Litorimonas sp. WD9-15 TaxID=3418716 RepID=UPI003CFDBA59
MIIAMWSGPRNLSTAMMRSFGSRADCTVMDEPFFAPYLAVSGKPHPGRKETLAQNETDPDRVAELCTAPVAQDYFFQKHMPHHMLDGFPMDWAKDAKHFLLIRHPQRVIASYAKERGDFEVGDLGFAPQRRLWEDLGRPPVIHSETILQNPSAALRALCAAIDIPFDPAMLSWEAGKRPEDGPWAPWWYKGVWASTGFGAPPKAMPEIAPHYHAMLDACLPDYMGLAGSALQI